MKKKYTYRFCLLIIATFFFVISGYSQADPPETDSTYDESAEAPADEYDEEESNSTYYPDTLKQQYRSIVQDSVYAINNDKGFYYKTYLDSLLRATQVKKVKQKRPIDLKGAGFFNSIFGVVFWIVAIGLFAYLVYRLFLSNSSLFSRNRKNIDTHIAVTEHQDEIDPDAILRNTIRAGNYRLAVRYLYLQALKRLSEKKYIEINSNKTNYEYVAELRKQKFANEFASLTLQYEYVWYGEYPVDEKLFDQIQNGFIQFHKNHIK